MKNKHRGMLSVLVGLTALAAAGVYAFSGIRTTPGQFNGSRPPAALQIKVPSESQVHQMQALSQRLAVLARPVTRASTDAPLTLLGDLPQDGPGHNGQEDPGDFLNAERKLSLTVAAGARRFCIIDGGFLTEGDKLPDGSRVLKIENQRVLLTLDKQSRWLYLIEDDIPATAEQNTTATAGKGKGQS